MRVFLWPWDREWILNQYKKGTSHEGKIDKFDYTKITKFCLSKDSTNWVKRQATEGEE